MKTSKVDAECNDCKKIFKLELEVSDKILDYYLRERFGDRGIVCEGCL